MFTLLMPYKSATPMKLNRITNAWLKKIKNIISAKVFSISSPFGGDRGGRGSSLWQKTYVNRKL
jgi:hypothetical protein